MSNSSVISPDGYFHSIKTVFLPFLFFFVFVFLIISVCLGVINHGMLLANRRSSSNRAPIIHFLWLKTDATLPAPRLSDNCNVKRLSIHSSSSRVKRPAMSLRRARYVPRLLEQSLSTRANYISYALSQRDCKSSAGNAFTTSKSVEFDEDPTQQDFSAHLLLKIY